MYRLFSRSNFFLKPIIKPPPRIPPHISSASSPVYATLISPKPVLLFNFSFDYSKLRNSISGSQVGQWRAFCSNSSRRESMQYDIVIVGAGPAGLSAAIRLKQLCLERNKEMSVCVVEKGSEVGAHIISGNVFEPRALNELIPNWRQEGAPIEVPVSSDKFWLLTENNHFPLPSPYNNDGNYIISLSQLARWMATKAEELGVEVYPGFAASEILYDENERVVGIGTNDMGIAKDGSKKETFQSGVELKGRLTFLAEGCRGSLSEKLIRKYKLREKAQGHHQTYALGIKEVWEIEEEKHEPGAVLHTIGWPLDRKTYGGTFLYHMKDRQVSIGLVVALNYRNPYLSPFDEFQKFKHHPSIKSLLERGTILQYGARTLNEGGFQSIPYPVFPGGVIIGCSAGFMNVPKIKGTHTAMKSGMLAAEAAFKVLVEGSQMETYWDCLKESWIWEELYRVRNYRPAFEHGLVPGLVISALERYIFRGSFPLTLKHGKQDHEATEIASLHTPIQYPKPDGVLSFDVPTSLYRSNTNHVHDQPAHLRLRDLHLPKLENLPKFKGLESRYCPAHVYELVISKIPNKTLSGQFLKEVVVLDIQLCRPLLPHHCVLKLHFECSQVRKEQRNGLEYVSVFVASLNNVVPVSSLFEPMKNKQCC